MPKFTPGPWKVETIREYRSLAHVRFSNGEDSVYVAAKSEPEEMANAYLIAAAPDLLKALKACRDLLFESYGEQNPFVDALIAKAEGKESA
jgi:hypothetical protein